MSDADLTDKLFPPTPEQLAQRNALAEVNEAVGILKKNVRAEIRALKRKRADELVPSVQKSLDEKIAAKEQEFKDVDWVFTVPSTNEQQTIQNHVRGLIKWDETMRKYGVRGH